MPYGNNSPYSSSGTPRPVAEDYAFMYSSPTPTPSPRNNYDYPPQRPATRASHVRSSSTAYPDPTFRPPTASPRYKSTGEYATISGGLYSNGPGYGYRDPREAVYETTASRRSSGKHQRRSSMSTPKKEHRHESPSTTSSRSKKPVATEEDRKRFKIPKGYSLKNWDPTEAPILLLGSVFDANSLGKWIYDWTANVHGPGSPMADIAGELWLLLIQLFGKVSRMEKVVGRIRSPDDRETIEEFLEAGDRLIRKLQENLKACEAPMMLASKNGGLGSLGMSSGVQFVKTFFGREQGLLEETQKYMQNIRTFNLRFDVNCETIVRNPTK